MNTLIPAPTADATLEELASLGMRAARVVARMMEIELQAVEVVAAWMPAPGAVADLSQEGVLAAQRVDAVQAAAKEAAPRIEGLGRALDRVSRSVRRCVALRRRMAAGWTGAGRVDDRAAMVRRQVARGVGAVIRRVADGEAAERLFDELAERLEEPGLEEEVAGLAVEEIIRLVCRDLGLAVEVVRVGIVPVGDGRVVRDTC